jgi:hypothetical protein
MLEAEELVVVEERLVAVGLGLGLGVGWEEDL